MGPQGEGMGVGEQMDNLVQKFESQKPGLSIEAMAHALRTDEISSEHTNKHTLEDTARNPESWTYKRIKEKYPDILDRELLIGALAKKYTDPEESESQQRINELGVVVDDIDQKTDTMEDVTHKGAIDQGYPPEEYTELINSRQRPAAEQSKLKSRRDEIADLIQFVGIMNDTEDELIQKQLENEANNAKMEHRIAIEKEEAVRKFEEYRILVPSEKDASGQTEVSLKEYLDGIAGKVALGTTSKRELETRIAHLRANFHFAFDPWVRKYVFKKYLTERKKAADEWLKWHNKYLYTETLTEEEQKSLDKATYEYSKMSIAVQIIEQVLR